MQSPPSLKRDRFEDPLDLSSSQPNSKRIKEETEPVETGLSGHQNFLFGYRNVSENIL